MGSRLALVLAARAALFLGGAADRSAELLVLQKDAIVLLDRIAAAPADVPALRREASDKLEALAAEETLPASLRDELRATAVSLREGRAAASAEGPRRLLDEVGKALRKEPLGLDFAGTYSVTRKPEPVYGGHSSAGAPPPSLPAALRTGPRSSVPFEVGAKLPHKTYCGGPTKDHILESTGSGVAILDYDGDGRQDIYLVNAYELGPGRVPIPRRNALYRNLGDWRFVDVSAVAGVDAAAWGNGVCAGDYDDDGRLDLYVTNFGRNFLFRNDGKGGFTETASEAGVAASGWSTGCAFFDADGDGDLDLYVARYVATSWEELRTAHRTLDWRGGPKVMVGPAGLPGEADLYFENRGGTFVDASALRGFTDPGKSYGLGVLATDYDNDGWIDVFVANDSNPNFLFHNLGHGRFESVALSAGVALNAGGRAQAGMGVDSGDYDDDGWLDIVLTTFAHDTKTLFRNLGGGTFEDASERSGLAAQTFEPMAWGTAFLDADLDGRPDLFVVNGHIYPNVEEFPALKETFAQRNQLLLNEGGGRFRDVTDTAGGGLQLRNVGRGLAVGDLDDDGDPDVVVNNMDAAPTVLDNRQQTGHHWISFRLEKEGSNRFAIGARVTVTQDGRRQIREVRSGGSYLSQSDLRPLFGLGEQAGTVDVEVALGGRTWRFPGLAVDQKYPLTLR